MINSNTDMYSKFINLTKNNLLIAITYILVVKY